jgi:hypothetical protein
VKDPLIVGPIGLTGVIVYWTNGILVMPPQERDTPITLEVPPVTFILIGVAVDKAKPVVLIAVAAVTVFGVEDPSLFIA